MPTLTRPGVYVDTSGFPTYIGTTPGVAAACFCGVLNRGPTVPTIVNSWKDFVNQYGGFETAYPPSAVKLAVFCYFSAGGTSAMIIRAIRLDAQGPLAGSHSFNDRAATTPLPTLKVNAANQGVWGNNIYIDITNGTILDATQNVLSFNIVVKYMGNGPQNVVEQWNNLSMTQGSTVYGQSNYALNVVNSAYSGSKYIRLQDLASTTTAPSNNPAVTGSSQQLTGGTDGTAI